MQPVLMIRSEVPGVVYINGRFAGEAGEDSAVSIPVSSRGTLYVELRPLLCGYLPLARRIALSHGQLVAASVEGQEGLFLVQWPGGVLDLELSPEAVRSAPPQTFERALGGMTVRLLRNGPTARLELREGARWMLANLPDGAQPPEPRQLADGTWFLEGELEGGGRYALIAPTDLSAPLLSISAREMELLDDGSLRALVDVGDIVGHAQLLTYRRGAAGYELTTAEPMWATGAPSWPATAEETALAALQAARLNLMDEAGAYFTAGFAMHGNPALREAAASDDCVRLKYPMPGGEQAVGLLHLIGTNAATVAPVTYRAQPMGGGQGLWRIDMLEI